MDTEYTHSAAAYRSNPDDTIAVPAGTEVDVEGLRVQLRLTPPGPFTIECKTSMLIVAEEGRVGLRFVLAGPRVPTRSPWQWLSADALRLGMSLVTHAFAAVPATGDPLAIHLQTRCPDGPATYSAGVLAAVAIRSTGVAWLPHIGLVAPLVASSS